MKLVKWLYPILGSLCCTSVFAQDIIIKKDFSIIKSKVVEVASSFVKYKKYSNIDSPIYTIEAKDIIAINYENGEKDVFEHKEQSIKNELKVIPDTENDSLIALYNKHIMYYKDKTSAKKASAYTYKFGMTSSSVLSTDEIEVSILLNQKGSWYNAPYVISLKNKTNDFLYIDLARCFKIYPDGNSECYYNTKQTTISNGKGVGASVGLGAVTNTMGIGGVVGSIANGISVGRNNMSSASATYSMQRFLSIPPNSTTNLTEYKGDGEGKNYRVVTNSEVFNIEDRFVWLKKGDITKYGVLNYTETNSPYKQKFVVSYSTNPEFENLSMINFEIFVQQVFGVCMESSYDYMYYKLDWEGDWKGIDSYTIMGTTIQFYKNDRKVKVE